MLANLSYRSSRALAGCFLLGLSACANPALNQQLATSKEAVDQAQIAGAAERAPTQLDSAVDKLNRANAAAKNRDAAGAMRLAQQSKADADLARATTDAAQAKFAAEELQKSNHILRDALTAQQNQQR